MAKRKKRKSVTLISLLLVLVALIGVYYWYSNREAKPEDENETESIQLSKIEDTSKLTSLHYRTKDTEMTLVKDGEEWKLETEPERPINQDKVSGLIGLISDITAKRMVTEKPDNPADFGLAEPTGYLQGTLSDGTTVTLEIGTMVPSKDGYYAYVNEDDKVYLLATNYGSGFKYTITNITAVAEAPSITADTIYHIAIDNRDGDDFEIVKDKNLGPGNIGSDVYPWHILKPYKEGYSADSTKVSTVQENYTGLTYETCVEYNATDLSLYGLDNPLSTIDLAYTEERTEKLSKPEKDPETGKEITEKTYQEPKEYKLLIGNQDETSKYYYVMEAGTKVVYTMEEDMVNKMLTVDPFSVLTSFINIPHVNTVDQIDINVNGKAYQFKIDHKKGTDEDGKETVENTIFFNGKQANEAGFTDLYQVLIGAKYDAEIKEEVNTEVAPYLTIKYQLNDPAKTVIGASYLPYDQSFYLIDTNGEIKFFADKRRIDDIVKKLEEYDPTVEPEE
jgi:hypothetical protein